MVKYNEIRDKLKTGDIVLFSGKGGISTAIRAITRSKWSHVGMVLVLPEYDFVCLWESTTLSNIPDLNFDIPRKGVQLVPLSSRIASYDGSVAIRYLDFMGGGLDKEDTENLMELRQELKGREYEQDEIELVCSAYDGPLGENKEDLSSLFCSELVAEAYQMLMLLTNEKPSNEYTPADFSAKNNLQLEFGKLGPEVMIK